MPLLCRVVIPVRLIHTEHYYVLSLRSANNLLRGTTFPFWQTPYVLYYKPPVRGQGVDYGRQLPELDLS